MVRTVAVHPHLSVVALASLFIAVGPVGAGPAASADRPALTTTGDYLTENVKSNPTMPQREVAHDVRAGAGLGAVVLWQEIRPDRYKAAVAGLPDRWRTVQLGTEDPISFNTNVWRLVSTDRAFLSRGRAHVTPDRWATWAVLQNQRSGRVVAFMDTHYVSAAWNSRPVSHKAWRKRQWVKEWRNQQQAVERLSQRGLTILGGGDFNRDRLPRFTDRQVNLNSGAIDHLWAVPAPGARIESQGTRRYGHLYSDHDAVVGRVQVRTDAS
jgi:hypothetical protein